MWSKNSYIPWQFPSNTESNRWEFEMNSIRSVEKYPVTNGAADGKSPFKKYQNASIEIYLDLVNRNKINSNLEDIIAMLQSPADIFDGDEIIFVFVVQNKKKSK